MYKLYKIQVFLLTSLIIMIFSISGCDKQEAAIFLNDTPITQNNFSNVRQNPAFFIGQRIYYILISKEPIESPILRLQTVKIMQKYGYNIPQIEIPYAIDIERGTNPHITNGYFVLHQDGNYFVRIFSLENLDKPIAEAEFLVEKR